MSNSRRRKRLGQHFLVDPKVIDDIISVISPSKSDVLVEIGPGYGALTKQLIGQVEHLFAIELDHSLALTLQNSIQSEQLTIIQEDALRFNYSALPFSKKIRFVGNLPYSISTKLIVSLQRNVSMVQDMCFMVQQEVADRLAASPGSRSYGRLSVNVGRLFETESVFVVLPDAFSPPPKVNSSVIYLRPKQNVVTDQLTVQMFSELTRAAFGNRRKTLKNSLAGLVNGEVFQESNIDARLRAQNLSVEHYMLLAKNAIRANSKDMGSFL